ncbi:MAG TPA: polyprenyl synthetase family protein [Planctomycetes bacterium]|nr:polyprenyl synthetase family protein [Planctomycetota bacterium]HIJ71076.1 polyprenyl synthetase family protein [Planctomycetota bacterium]
MTNIEEIRSKQVNFKVALADKAGLVNSTLSELLQRHPDIIGELKTAIKYSLESPGKRIRGALVLWSCELVCGAVNCEAETAAAAIEMVHAYSLVHDDLPAMDNDDLRRGRPSCHKKFDEATAILAGDGLLTLAFEILASEISEPGMAVRMIKTLASACGPAGMIEGQMADLQSQNSRGTMDILRHIHINKTAKMFAAAAVMGAIAGGANDEQIEHLLKYGLKLGLGFQVADDILDISASSEHLGKTSGKDARQGKVTYPAVAGLAESERIAESLCHEAVESLDIFGAGTDFLRQLAVAMLERTR